MTEICLVRHGETDWNAQELIQGSADVALNDLGRAQAHAAAELLAAHRPDVIYASPLSRAYDTASIIADSLGLSPILTDPALVERRFGAAEGIPISERRKRYGTGPIPGAEDWSEVRTRSLRAMESIRDAHAGRRVLVVTHGGVIKSLVAYMSGDRLNPRDIAIRNASASLVVWDGRWHIEWLDRVADFQHVDTAAIAGR
ncbi:MAG: histidine phosphatase family protein [Spirochaetaceae bacterium]